MVADPQRFFVIGAQRSGTTLLHRRLAAHPEVAMHMPVRPEPKHFLDEGAERVPVGEYDRRWFQDLESPVRGEKCTTYLERPDAGARILRRFPSARFVVVVRDPVDRAISNYRFSRDHGVEDRPLAEALSVEGERRPHDPDRFSTSPYAYLRRGRYAEQLEAWAEVVGRDRILVLSFADVVHGALECVQDFLGLDRADLPAPVEPMNDAMAEVDVQEVATVRRRLARYFAEPNRLLRDDWDVDTSSWETTT